MFTAIFIKLRLHRKRKQEAVLNIVVILNFLFQFVCFNALQLITYKQLILQNWKITVAPSVPTGAISF